MDTTLTKKLKAGQRIQAIRKMLGVTQAQFSKMVGVSHSKITNIETLRVKATQDELENICSVFPFFCNWIVFEGDIKISEIEESDNLQCKIIASKIKLGIFPSGLSLEDKIK